MLRARVQNALQDDVDVFDDLDGFVADQMTFKYLTARYSAFLHKLCRSLASCDVYQVDVDFGYYLVVSTVCRPVAGITALSADLCGTRTGYLLDMYGNCVYELWYMRRVRCIVGALVLVYGGTVAQITPKLAEPTVLFDHVGCVVQHGDFYVLSRDNALLFVSKSELRRVFELRTRETLICVAFCKSHIYAAAEHEVIDFADLEEVGHSHCQHRIFCAAFFNGEPVFGTSCSLFRYACKKHVFAFSNAVLALLATDSFLVAFYTRKALIFTTDYEIAREIVFPAPCVAFAPHSRGFYCAGRELLRHDFKAKDDEM